MKYAIALKTLTVTVLLGLAVGLAAAFDSGSTGDDGAFNPTVDTEVVLPPDGILNYTDVDIPSGVTVSFQRNALNTPVFMLASGDITVAGTIDVSGTKSTDVSTGGDGNLGDDGIPGKGGPGGFDGGPGGKKGNKIGGHGQGPGAGFGTLNSSGGWASFATLGNSNLSRGIYGNPELLPLIGGSGGGGAGGATAFTCTGGGGGGGAILLAATGTVDITGSILALGGNTGASGVFCFTGGVGSGGAVKIVATTISGNGLINALGAGQGRIRLEAEILIRTATGSGSFSFSGTPGDLFVTGMPTLRITSVAGMAAPGTPTGDADITLPSSTVNPVTVEFEATNVPLGNTITLLVSPAEAPQSNVDVTAVSDALSGTLATSTADATVDLPDGANVLQAQVSFTVVASLGDALSNFAQGERVESVEIAAGPDGGETTFVTVSGKRYTWPSNAVALR